MITTAIPPNPNKPEQDWSPHRLLSSNFKSLGTPPQVGARFLHILLTSPKYLSALLDLLQTQPGATKDFSLEVDAFELIHQMIARQNPARLSSQGLQHSH